MLFSQVSGISLIPFLNFHDRSSCCLPFISFYAIEDVFGAFLIILLGWFEVCQDLKLMMLNVDRSRSANLLCQIVSVFLSMKFSDKTTHDGRHFRRFLRALMGHRGMPSAYTATISGTFLGVMPASPC